MYCRQASLWSESDAGMGWEESISLQTSINGSLGTRLYYALYMHCYLYLIWFACSRAEYKYIHVHVAVGGGGGG